MGALKKYLILFLVANIAIAMIYALISYLFQINIGQGILATILSAQLAGLVFCKDHNRLPTEDERKILIRGSFMIAIILTIVGIGLMVLGQYLETGELGIGNLNPMLALISIAIGVVVTYLLLLLSYGWLLRKTARRYNQDNA